VAGFQQWAERRCWHPIPRDALPPGLWCAASPGAGFFAETAIYTKAAISISDTEPYSREEEQLGDVSLGLPLAG